MKLRIFSSISLSVFTAVLFTGCGGDDAGDQARRPDTVQVPVVEVRLADFPLFTTAMATLEPYDRANIATRMMGQVTKVHVEEGDRVKKGQPLLQLDSRDVNSRIEQARAGLAAAKSQLENAEAYYNRIKRLYDQQSATKQNLDNALNQYEAAKAGAQAAESRVTEAASQLDYAVIRAPFDGFVTGRSMQAGDMGSPGVPLVTVEMQDSLKVITTVSEMDVANISPAGSAWVESDVPGFGRRLARIESVVPAGDPSTRRFKVRLVLPNQDGAVKSGIFARVLFQTGSTQAVSVPEEAVVRRGQLTGLFVVGPDSLTRLRWVRLGRTSGGMVEILSGVAPGDRVVAGSLRLLREGQKVQEVSS